MTDLDKEQQIRARAHALWEEQGRPEGQQDIHWEQARREFEEGSKQASVDGMPSAKNRQPRKPAAPKGNRANKTT